MRAKLQWVAILAGVLVVALVVREIFPKTETVHTPPEIVTVYDTIPVVEFDTVRLPAPPPDTLPPRIVVVTEVDTVEVAPDLPPVFGATRVVARGLAWGDTLDVQGFELRPDPETPGTLLRRDWRVSYFITGPLESIVVDSVPPVVTFHELPDSRSSSNMCPYLLRVIPLPCDPGFTVGAMWMLTPPDAFPLSAYGLADVAFGSKKVRVGVLATTDLTTFITVGYRF